MAAWLAARGSGDQADTLEWLYAYGLSAALTAPLMRVLIRVWTEGWELGEQSAFKVLGIGGKLADQLLQDVLSQFASGWAGEIVGTLMHGIAGILAAGGSAASLEQQIKGLLGNLDNAKRIVQTELTRAINAAASAFYRFSRVHLIRWVTEHDARVCPACAENEAAGPWPLGQPFPAGALFPPQHPRCRCALMPA